MSIYLDINENKLKINLDWRTGDSIEDIQNRQYKDLIELGNAINHSKLNSEFLEINGKI